MNRKISLTFALMGALFVGACSGESEAPAEEGTEAATPEMTSSTTSPIEGCFLARGTAEEAMARTSPRSAVSFSYASGDGQICYGAPSMRGRVVFGELEAFGSPWRAGADEATTIRVTGPASIGGVAVEAGTYSIYAVPGETEWEFFVNSNAERWGIPIDDGVRSTEVGSFTVTPEATDGPVETLRYTFEPDSEGAMGDIVLEWENTRIRFHLHPGEV